jgi:Alpha/beta hydrolase domain
MSAAEHRAKGDSGSGIFPVPAGKHGHEPGSVLDRVFPNFHRRDWREDANSERPKCGTVRKTYTVGSSQSGAFLHGFIFWGFSKDENGRKVFDGGWPQIDGPMLDAHHAGRSIASHQPNSGDAHQQCADACIRPIDHVVYAAATERVSDVRIGQDVSDRPPHRSPRRAIVPRCSRQRRR